MTPNGNEIAIEIGGTFPAAGDEIAINIGGQPDATVDCNIAAIVGTASSTDTATPGQFDPANVLDGNLQVGWTGDGSQQSSVALHIDLGSAFEIIRYRIGANDVVSQATTEPPEAWTFEGSADAISWTELDAQTGQTLTKGEFTDFEITAAEFRYFRIVITAPNVPHIGELELIARCLPALEPAAASVAVAGQAAELAEAALIPAPASIVIAGQQAALADAALIPAPAHVVIAGQPATLTSPGLRPAPADIIIEAQTPALLSAGLRPAPADVVIEPIPPDLSPPVEQLIPGPADIVIAGQPVTLAAEALRPGPADIVAAGQQPVLLQQDLLLLVRRTRQIPYTDRLPLRLSSEWGNFDDVVPVPFRYGAVTGELIAFSANRTLWVWADHACLSIDAVTIGGLPVGNWRWYNGTDETGHAVCFVEFAEPVDLGVTPVACGRGRMSAAGALITNPADVVMDIRAAIAGQTVPPQQMLDFRFACAAADINIAGTVGDDRMSLQGQITEIISSIDGLWSPDMTSFAVLADAPGAPRAVIGRLDGGRVLADSDLDQIINRLTLAYAHDHDGATRSITMSAPDSIDDYGLRQDSIDAPWIHSPALAERTVKQILQRRARPGWRISINEISSDLAIGDTVEVAAPALPVAGDMLITSASRSVQARTVIIGGMLHAVPVPRTSLVSVASKFAASASAGATLSTQGDERVLTILDSSNQPVASAQVTLNGEFTRLTDSGGRVSFPSSLMPPGEHSLLIRGTGIEFEITVTV